MNNPTIKTVKNGNNAQPQDELKATCSMGFFFLFIYTVLVFVRPHEWPLFEINFPLLRIFIILAFVSYLVSLAPKIWNVQCSLLLGMFFVVVLSEFRAFRFFSNAYVMQESFVSNFLPFLLYVGFLQTHGRQKWIMFVSMAASLIMVQQAWSQISNPLGIGWAEAAMPRGDALQARYIGIFNDPNDMGMFLIMNMPIAVYFMTQATSKIMRLLYLTCVVAFLAGIYWTGSRGSLVGTFVVFIAFFYLRYGKPKTIVLSLLASPVALFVMTKFRAISTDDESANSRLEAWYQGVQMFKYRPLFGVGKEQFVEYHNKTAHNSYVLTFAELGTAGYTLWMTFIVIMFYMLIRIRKLDPQRATNKALFLKEQSVAVYLTISMIGFCTTAFFISRTYILFFYIFAAMCAACYIRASRLHPDLEPSISWPSFSKCALGAFISLPILYVIIVVLLGL
ncbi:O-antigen ligase family protein [Alteromonas sp. C1M14]|uniref:O-antigen ligase family protein n=1 Tax=Alteromonas sp. C1M14 TaxID=2841567 RepID=UPI001C083260|nr:O-antigen ligase family protein [Alteromonas sp. C1M14]MBU2979214.1 O-antigen ligase family protein [Alteromonas sp. C1M14]